MFRINETPPEVLEKAEKIGIDMLTHLSDLVNNSDTMSVGELKLYLSIWPDQYIVAGIQGLQMAGEEKH